MVASSVSSSGHLWLVSQYTVSEEPFMLMMFNFLCFHLPRAISIKHLGGKTEVKRKLGTELQQNQGIL